MPINPLLYQKRHNALLRAMNPTLTSKQYLHGWDETNSRVNMLVGVSNEVARLAVSDGIDALKAAGLYKQRTKQLCKETVKRQEEYEAMHNKNFGDRLKLWLDYLDSVENEYRQHIFHIYMTIKQVMDRYRDGNTEVKARLECARICCTLAVGEFDDVMKSMWEKYGVDYTALFHDGRYDRVAHTWDELCSLWVKTDDPKGYINLNADAQVNLAVDVLARKLNDTDYINRMEKFALDHNLDTAEKYISQEDIEILEQYGT